MKWRFFATYAIDFGFSIICKKKEQKTGKGKVIITMTKLKYYEASVDNDDFAVVEAKLVGAYLLNRKNWAVTKNKEHEDDRR